MSVLRCLYHVALQVWVTYKQQLQQFKLVTETDGVDGGTVGGSLRYFLVRGVQRGRSR